MCTNLELCIALFSVFFCCCFWQGDYGLREAVMEIKVKKKELALRDK